MNGRPWIRALGWLVFLAPFFFLTYNYANAMAARRAWVPVLAFEWERHVPFIAWTILPYWSSDLLYALSLFVCRRREELDLHGKRLVAIQVFSIACFLLFPLRCTFARPELNGWQGDLFGLLLSFDQPFNQAPSLHVSLAVILWTRYREVTTGALRVLFAAWLVLVAVSTLTTYQHHFIDLPTGLWAGLLVIAALPERFTTARMPRLSLIYFSGAFLFTVGAFWWRQWILLWPGFALSMVAAGYWTGDSVWIGKRHGRVAPWMWPYTVAAWVSSRVWTRGEPSRAMVADQVWVGRAPSASDRDGMKSFVDVTAELPLPSDAWVPMLDLAPPTVEQLDAAVHAIAKLENRRPTLVNCALGYSRSAASVAAWLVVTGRASDVEEAIARVRAARPQVIFRPRLRERLEEWDRQRRARLG